MNFKMKVFLTLLLFILRTGNSQERFTFSVDIGKYKADKGLTYLEIYTSVPRNQLKYEFENDRFVGNFNLEITILKGDSIYFQNDYKKIDYAKNLSDINESQKLLSCIKLYIKEGSYRLNVELTDLISQNISEVSRPLLIETGAFNSFSISDIELSSSLTRTATRSEFYKNGYQILPNPERIFGAGLPLLYYYCEIYNLSFTENEEIQTYNVFSTITTLNGDTIKRFPVKTRKKPGLSSIEVGGFNIMGYEGGTYNLNLAVKDNETGEIIHQKKEFYIVKPSQIAARQAAPQKEISSQLSLENRIKLEEIELESLDQKQVEEVFDKMRYITTDNDKRIYNSLSFPEKKRFIAVFWARSDPNPETAINELKREYFEKMNYVNSQYSERKAGWKTDRGRVFMQYGKPDDIEYFPNSPGTPPYQIWYYYRVEQEGTKRGVEFVFADIRKNGEYIMVHSTALREVHNYNWLEYIRRGF